MSFQTEVSSGPLLGYNLLSLMERRRWCKGVRAKGGKSWNKSRGGILTIGCNGRPTAQVGWSRLAELVEQNNQVRLFTALG